MTHKRNAVALCIAAFMALSLFVACERSSADQPKPSVQSTIQDYINANTINGTFFYYDPVDNILLKLKGAHLHTGVKQKGVFQVSCADFTDQNGRKLDLDFFVINNKDSYCVAQGLLHKVDGNKRPYDLSAQ